MSKPNFRIPISLEMKSLSSDPTGTSPFPLGIKAYRKDSSNWIIKGENGGVESSKLSGAIAVPSVQPFQFERSALFSAIAETIAKLNFLA